MRKPNYQQARKQKELSRKARQQEKQQKRVITPEDGAIEGGAAEPIAPADPAARSVN